MKYKNTIEELEKKVEVGQQLTEQQAIKLHTHSITKTKAYDRRKKNFIQFSFRVKRSDEVVHVLDLMEEFRKDLDLTKGEFIIQAIDSYLNQSDLIEQTRKKAFGEVYSLLSDKTKKAFSKEFEGKTKSVKDLISFLDTKNNKTWGF